jgi:hypothetical protein
MHSAWPTEQQIEQRWWCLSNVPACSVGTVRLNSLWQAARVGGRLVAPGRGCHGQTGDKRGTGESKCVHSSALEKAPAQECGVCVCC